MNHIKALYETPDVEEIVFASMDAIALSEDNEDMDSNEDVDNGNIGWN